MHRRNVTLRVAGVDCPETRTKNTHEKMCGLHVKRVVTQLLDNQIVCVEIETEDKFGRALGTLRHKDIGDLSEWLIRKGYATEYDGKKKTPFNSATYKSLLKEVMAQAK